ncbi:MAG: hypothetical protein D6820_06085, partial [Lentisphaerae bacterium]
MLSSGVVAISPQDASYPWHFVPPAQSGVVNVKDYGAVGDGVHDDTAAIREAIRKNIDRSRYRHNPMIWFPKGVYKVTGPIESRVGNSGWSAGWRSMLYLVGESRGETIIKLADRTPGYDNPNKPKWVIATGSESDNRKNYHGGGNRAFRHGIMNLTVDVGEGNPGAIGIDFIANNRGSIDNVTIRAGARSGAVGINLTRNWPGPALITNVLIDGFDVGIAAAHYQYGMTFEHIVLRNQRKVGVSNKQNVLAMRRIDFAGKVPFYRCTSSHGLLALLDSRLRFEGGNPPPPAIRTSGLLTLHRIDVKGFETVVEDTGKKRPRKSLRVKTPGGEGTYVTSFYLGKVMHARAKQPAKPLNLAIEDVPIIRPPEGATWVDAGNSGETLQSAIDSGAEWIYVKPTLAVTVTKPIILRGRVRLLMGLNGHLRSKDPKVPCLIVDEGEVPVVAVENMYIEGRVIHRSTRTFVLRHGDLHHGMQMTGSGKTHIVDVIGKGYEVGRAHHFWGRQINSEFGSKPLFTNYGTSWILGFKMESSTRDSKRGIPGTPCLLNKGGRFEMFGGLLYTLGSKSYHAPSVPAFTNHGGSVALNYRLNGIPSTYYRVILRHGTL